MEFSKETPRREITVAGVVLSVIAPFNEGHVLTAEQANVLNQTLAENLRNNFASRVKEVKEQSGENVDTKALQKELNEYIKEYEFGAKRQAGVAVDPITKIALRYAKDAVKKALVNAQKNPKDFTAEQLDELAKGALDKNPRFRELAEQEHNLRKAAASETLQDIAA